MKKSELYHIAMDAVLDSGYSNDIKLAVIDVLMGDQRIAKFTEEAMEKEAQNG